MIGGLISLYIVGTSASESDKILVLDMFERFCTVHKKCNSTINMQHTLQSELSNRSDETFQIVLSAFSQNISSYFKTLRNLKLITLVFER